MARADTDHATLVFPRHLATNPDWTVSISAVFLHAYGHLIQVGLLRAKFFFQLFSTCVWCTLVLRWRRGATPGSQLGMQLRAIKLLEWYAASCPSREFQLIDADFLSAPVNERNLFTAPPYSKEIKFFMVSDVNFWGSMTWFAVLPMSTGYSQNTVYSLYLYMYITTVLKLSIH